MNNDVTIDTLSFKLRFSDKSGSVRSEVSRGANLPTEMKVAHTEYVDSQTKVKGRRSLLRFDRYVSFSTGIIAPVSAYVVVQVPENTGVTSADVLAVVQHLNNSLFAATGNTAGLDLKDEIFVAKEQ